MKKMMISLCCVLLVLAVWVHLDRDSFAGEHPEREYWYSSDPGARVLVVRFTGGLRAGVHTNTVFGDGRYEYQLTTHSGKKIAEDRLEVQLSNDEMTRLLDRAVHAGLMEFDKAAVEQKMRALAPPFHVNDAVTMFVDIHLERYRASNEKEAAPASRSMSIRAVGSHAKIFTEIEEIQALNDVAETMAAFRRSAELQHAN